MLTLSKLAAVALAAMAALMTAAQADSPRELATGSLILVDVRSYRHCHNLPRRVVCHTKDLYPPHRGPAAGNETGVLARAHCDRVTHRLFRFGRPHGLCDEI